MWNEIATETDLVQFMERMYYFHDSCIKEMRYVSGAYVQPNLSMYPINDKRTLYLIIQRQFDDVPVIEMRFSGLKMLKLQPSDEDHTCEILDATMILKQGYIYWCDCGGLENSNLEEYNGTLIAASKVSWRELRNGLGKEEIYQ